jgi:hypothetical protein
MKPVKFVLLALGALCAIAVFLPFVDAGILKASFWELREAKAAPTFIALLGSLALAGIAGLGVAKSRFTRGMAAGTAVLGLVIAAITILQFSPEAPFAKVAGTGAKLLLGGGLIAFVASIVGLIKPDRSATA